MAAISSCRIDWARSAFASPGTTTVADVPMATERPLQQGRRCRAHGARHRDVPPEVTTGVVVVVVGREVVVVAVSLLPDEPVVVVVVEVDEPEELVLVVSVAPGCSLDTATPINAVAPVAARIAVRVKVRTRGAGTLAGFWGVVLIGVSNGHASH